MDGEEHLTERFVCVEYRNSRLQVAHIHTDVIQFGACKIRSYAVSMWVLDDKSALFFNIGINMK